MGRDLFLQLPTQFINFLISALSFLFLLENVSLYRKEGDYSNYELICVSKHIRSTVLHEKIIGTDY